jgi:hypothetical protein
MRIRRRQPAFPARALKRGLRTLATRLGSGRESESQSLAQLAEGLRRIASQIQERRDNGEWISEFVNLFAVTGRTGLEAAHSSVVAWLLDPQESHGLRDRVLHEFLLAAGGRAERAETTGATIKRECRCGRLIFDIVVTGRNRDWFLVVENKVNSPEGDGQTSNYCATLEKRYGKIGEKVFCIFLTRGKKAGDGRFKAFSYRRLRGLLSVAKPGGDAAVIVRHFCDHILRNLED